MVLFMRLDKVSLPSVNIRSIFRSKISKYSLFRNIIEKNLVTYVFNQAATTTYRNFTGKSDDVYVKLYDPALAFSPNNENFLKEDDNDGQSDAYTMFVPDNDALQIFIDNVLLKHYFLLINCQNIFFKI